MVNLYDTPAQAEFINTYVPIQFEGLYKLADRAREDIKEGNALLDNLAKYKSLGSLSNVDNENWNKKVGDAYSFIDKNVKDVYSLQDPTVKAQLHQITRNLESDPEMKNMLESKEMFKKALEKEDPRWGGRLAGEISGYDSRNGVYSGKALDWVEYTDVADAYTKDLKPALLGVSKSGFTNEYGISETTLWSTIVANKEDILSNPALMERAKIDFNDLIRSNPEEAMQYFNQNEDGSVSPNLAGYALKRVFSAAIDKTKGRTYDKNDEAMFKYSEAMQQRRHNQKMAVEEEAAALKRLSTQLALNAEAQAGNNKIDVVMNAITNKLVDATPENRKTVGESVFGPEAYRLYELELDKSKANSEIRQLDVYLSKAQADGNAADVEKWQSQINDKKRTISKIETETSGLTPFVVGKIAEDEGNAMKYGRGKVFDYNTSTGTSVIQFSSTFGNRWNRDNYGGGREVTVTRSDGNKETIVPVTNTTGISVTNPGNLDDEVLRYTAYIRGQKSPSTTSAIQKSVQRLNDAISSGIYNGSSYIRSTGRMRADVNSGTRAGSEMLIPADEMPKGLTLPTYLNIRTEELTIDEFEGERIKKKYYVVPISTPFTTKDKTDPSNLHFDAGFQTKEVYK